MKYKLSHHEKFIESVPIPLQAHLKLNENHWPGCLRDCKWQYMIPTALLFLTETLSWIFKLFSDATTTVSAANKTWIF